MIFWVKIFFFVVVVFGQTGVTWAQNEVFKVL